MSVNSKIIDQETKQCNRCGEERSISQFYFKKSKNRYDTICNPCHALSRQEKRKDPLIRIKEKANRKKFYNANKKKMNKRHTEYYNKNKDILKPKMKEYYLKNRDSALKYAEEKRVKLKKQIENGDYIKPDIKRKICKKCKQEKDISCFTYRKSRNYYESRCKKCNMLRERKHREEKKDEINARRRMIKKKLSIQRRLSISLRRRVNCIIFNRPKKNLYYDLLGCTIEHVIKWFEYIFENDKELGMNWNNYGNIWQIDHVTPCASFNLTDKDQQKKCFHWTNLCPVLKEYNLAKQAKIVRNDQLKQAIRLSDFIKAQYSFMEHKYHMVLVTKELSV